MNVRNMARSVMEFMKTPVAEWKVWTVANAVKEGYKVSGWVFKSVSIISKNIAMVPWVVKDRDGNIIKGHPITLLLENPNKAFSKQDFFELLSSWLQLSGEAYVKQITVNGVTKELWPISPDRITPVASNDPLELIGAYETKDSKGNLIRSEDFTPENIISFRFLDPADPIRGVGPLQVAAKAVDIDQEQLNWNKAAMQNRGIVDGVFTFKKDLDKAKWSTYKQAIKEMFGGKRDIGVIGSEATYQRLSLTPAEMDFITSRKFNREEIFIVFGVPPQLAGAQEVSTYNNFSTARVVFWETTLTPILDDLKNTLNKALSDQLGEYHIDYDLTGIPALKKDQKEKAETAKIYSDMGVPMKQLNEMFSLGVPEYDGWDKSIIKVVQATNNTDNSENRGSKALMLKKLEMRSIDADIAKREELAVKNKSKLTKALKEQQDAVFKAIDEKRDIAGTLSENSETLSDSLSDIYMDTAFIFAGTVLVDERGTPVDFETRAIPRNLQQTIEEFITIENTILTELSLINASTVDIILKAAIDAEEEGKTVTQIQQAILDSGTFSPERALRIARTTVGTAQSIGQMAGAIEAGATKKTWHDSNFDVRSEHSNRDGETIGMDERFSSQFPDYPAPRWPLDQNIAPADRINCRCAMSFS